MAFSYHNLSNNNWLDLAKYVGTGGNCPGNSAWNCESVDSHSSFVGLSTSLAYGPGPDYTPRIAYFDFSSSRNLKLATYIVGSSGNCPGNSAWNCEIVDGSQGNYADYSNLALRSDGKAVISYYNSANKQLKLAIEVTSGSGDCTIPDNPSNWKCITIATPNGSDDAENSLVLLSDTEARISFYDSNTRTLKFASITLPGGTPSIETVDSSNYAGQYNSLAIFDSTPMIAYYVANTSSDPLRFARWVGSGGNCPGNAHWQCEVIEKIGNIGQYVSLKVNQYGMHYLTYYDAENGDLKMAHLGFQAFLPLAKK